MACTSITSAQLIAMSSIFSFDIYGTYINKSATNRQLITMSHVGVVGSWLIVASLATAFHEGGVDLNWLLYMLGILICPGTFPTAFALVWKRQTRLAALISPLVGIVCGVGVWVGIAEGMYGKADIKSLGMTMPCLYATVTSTFVPLPITIAMSYIWPNRSFEWSSLLSIERIEDNEHGRLSQAATRFDPEAYFSPSRLAYMKRMSRIAFWVGVGTFLCQWALWPLPMYARRMIFSKGLFIAWVVIALVWLWVALVIACFFPLFDGGFRKIWIVLRGTRATDELRGNDQIVLSPQSESKTSRGDDIDRQNTEVVTTKIDQ